MKFNKIQKFYTFLNESVNDIQGVDSKLDFFDDDEFEDDSLLDLLTIIMRVKHKSDSEINEYVQILIDTYYDILDDSSEDNNEDYDLSDFISQVLELIDNELDPEDILDVLEIDDVEIDYIEDDFNNSFNYIIDMFEGLESLEVLEAVTGRFLTTNRNKKRRKFMQKSAQQLNREKVKRRQDNIRNRAKRRQSYRKNKTKIQRYQKQYKSQIKQGTHFKKLRRRSGVSE